MNTEILNKFISHLENDGIICLIDRSIFSIFITRVDLNLPNMEWHLKANKSLPNIGSKYEQSSMKEALLPYPLFERDHSSFDEIGKHCRLKIYSYFKVIGSSPIVSIRFSKEICYS